MGRNLNVVGTREHRKTPVYLVMYTDFVEDNLVTRKNFRFHPSCDLMSSLKISKSRERSSVATETAHPMADNSMFPKFFNLPSNDKLEKLLLCTGKEGHKKDGNHDKHKYFLSLCRYTCTIPSWDQNGQLFGEKYEPSLFDMALMKASENGEFLKWSRLTTPVYAVAVPDEGQSLFHAVSTAMWGLQDKRSTLKQLMENSVPYMADSLKARWQIYASDVKAEERQTAWSNIIARLEGRPSIYTSLRKDEEIDSLAIFILANVIHRPIIVIEIPSHASSYSTERFDAEGLFLPLEKPPLDCSKSPIILCHRDHRFCPLMFMSSVNSEALFPLHKRDLSILPVRYGLDDRNTVALISQYLNIQEKDVISETGSTITLFCSSVAITPLPEHFNSINIHMNKCQDIFQDSVASRKTNDTVVQKVSMPPVGQCAGSHPFQSIEESSQTYVVPLTLTGSRRKEGSSLSSPPLLVSLPPPLSLYNSKTSLSDTGREGLPTNIQTSTVQNSITETESERGGIDKKRKCLTPGCIKHRDPGTGELCYSCFTKSTVHESGLELLSLYEDGKRRYVLCKAHLPGEDIDQQQLSMVGAANEIPSMENIPEAHSEMLSMPFLSVMNESCKGCSHYYCSQKTYPYCHECSKKASENFTENHRKQNVAPIVERSNADKKQSFPDFVFLPPMNINHPEKSLGQKVDIESKQDESVDIQIVQNFCQSEGCHSLRQENSTVCFQCSCEGKSRGNASPGLQIAYPRHQISSIERRGPLQLGQAECLSHNSNEDVIEISEAPSVECDVHKCASPVCETIIPSSQMLCEKCQSILISHSQHHNRNEHLRGAKNDWENQQTLSAYRAGTFSGIIANSPSSQVKQPQKILSEKISASGPKVGSRPKETTGELKLRQEREMRAKGYNDKLKRTFDPFSHSNPSTSINSTVTQPASQPSSFSRAVDKNFQKMYTQFTNEQLKAVTKCRSDLCQNYGNKLKHGYCNSCFSSLSEDARHIAIFGMTERDSR